MHPPRRSIPTNRRATRRWSLAIGSTCLLATMLVPGSASADPVPPSPPAQPVYDPDSLVLGSEGPCDTPPTTAYSDSGPNVIKHANDLHPGRFVWEISPSGEDETLLTGGTCDDHDRPVVVVVHGFPYNELVTYGVYPATPKMYEPMIRNLVSHGFIVVFAQYSWLAVVNWLPPYIANVPNVANTVTDGVVPVVDAATHVRHDGTVNENGRMNPRHLGVVGHSLGGGAAPIVVRTLATRQPMWGTGSRWLTMVAATDLYFRCPMMSNRFNAPDGYDFSRCGQEPPLPSNTRAMFIDASNDDVGITETMVRMFLVMNGTSSKWLVGVRTDCTHSPGGCTWESGTAAAQDCPDEPSDARDCQAGHFLPTRFSEYPTTDTSGVQTRLPRIENHLVYYGLYRNLHMLHLCAQHPVAVCSAVNLSSMGVWSDGVPAQTAEFYSG